MDGVGRWASDTYKQRIFMYIKALLGNLTGGKSVDEAIVLKGRNKNLSKLICNLQIDHLFCRCYLISISAYVFLFDIMPML